MCALLCDSISEGGISQWQDRVYIFTKHCKSVYIISNTITSAASESDNANKICMKFEGCRLLWIKSEYRYGGGPTPCQVQF